VGASAGGIEAFKQLLSAIPVDSGAAFVLVLQLNTGDPAMLAEVVWDLYSGGDGSGGSFSQRNLFELALDRLSAEFATVNRIRKAEAAGQLNQTLAESREGSFAHQEKAGALQSGVQRRS
jgi:CarD-like protein/CheB methylesterase